MAEFEIHLEVELMGLDDEFDMRGEEKRKIKFDSLKFIYSLRNRMKSCAIYYN